ncbi:YggT family protein [Uliginosibacterium sp. H3]|uniref:YggT family protein n=1 Tax=Uliginosibacterium silvisoli TaxID=3114758 RepID=A0ABU6K1X4_9RHOO|nr:YggT family protein [Uliginosibacterium sp. H3]
MLIQMIVFLLQTVIGFFCMLLLVRTAMRWMRISFVNQIGQFVLVTTNWAVVPMQRVLPSVGRLDLSSLVPAWLLQVVLVLLISAINGFGFNDPVAVLVRALGIGALELLRSALYLLMFVVIIGAAISWVNPRAPMAPVLNMLTRPFLDPIRRIVPPVANVDLSPFVLLVVVQLLLIAIA